jgi:hypothetical protein
MWMLWVALAWAGGVEPPAEVDPADETPPIASDPSADAAQAYDRALRAWNGGNWPRALAEARAAEAFQPGHRPARLLEGYALCRLGMTRDGLDVLDKLAAEPVVVPLDHDIYVRADRVYHRIGDRYRRDQWAFGIGLDFRAETVWHQTQWTSGYALTLDGPALYDFGIRFEGVMPFATRTDSVPGGPRLAIMAVRHQKIGKGIWQADLGLGPSVWVARGTWWGGNTKVHPGVRAAAGLDVRPLRGFGFRTEVGWSAHPGAWESLQWYVEAPDLRFAMTFYPRARRPY